MNRCLALICAVLLSAVTVASACVAAPGDPIGAGFGNDDGGVPQSGRWSGVMPSELIGVDLAGFHRSGTRPLRVALIRELFGTSG